MPRILTEVPEESSHVHSYKHIVEKGDKEWVMGCDCGETVRKPSPKPVAESKDTKKVLMG